MIKPNNLPGAGMVNDTLDFVKNLWGSMQVPGVTTLPGMAAPTLSVEELDKKINDLKAVEAWMNLNLGMLRGSIQALEVQRGTIATLKSMGATLSNAVKGSGEDAANAEKSLLAVIPYASAFLFPNANPAPTTPDEMEKNIAAQAPPPPPETGAKPEDDAGADKKTPPDFAAQLAQTGGAWWGMLQEQFKQVVASAMAADKPVAKTRKKAPAAEPEKAPAKPRKAAPRRSPAAKAEAGVKKSSPRKKN
ncbi:PhaM family polyhydroxyalkanoate granule multifunctional regulatory protein [Massilia sp. W12]|uniref:PhaM family polyhydroxyalkanoate granule multifunctional regulatory protein n=1 Tax=Massilia sp. W12 TaxID=3126507 RepID=UPI0030CE4564